MQTAIRRMGNSAAILLPKTVLAHLEVTTGDVLELKLEKGRIVLSPIKSHPREGWADAAKSIAEAGDDVLVMPAFANVDDEALEW